MEEQVKETKKVTKTKKTTKKATTKKTINIKNELKKKSKEIEVEVMNITDGTVYYRDKEGNELDIEYTGDTDVVSLKFLESIKTRRDMLEKLYVSICDVYDDDYTVEDIISYLGLTDLYSKIQLNLDSIDDALENSSIEEFEELLKQSNNVMIARLCERAARLAKENRFDSNYKRMMLEEITGNPYIFKAY